MIVKDGWGELQRWLYWIERGRGLAECCFTSTETVGLLGTGAQDGHVEKGWGMGAAKYACHTESDGFTLDFLQ